MEEGGEMTGQRIPDPYFPLGPSSTLEDLERERLVLNRAAGLPLTFQEDPVVTQALADARGSNQGDLDDPDDTSWLIGKVW
jgi:hypothetical protein